MFPLQIASFFYNQLNISMAKNSYIGLGKFFSGMRNLVVSAELLEELQLSPSELLIDLAVYLYDKEKLTMGQAKKLAGLTQIAFQAELVKREVFIKYDVDDLETDLENLNLRD